MNHLGILISLIKAYCHRFVFRHNDPNQIINK